MANRNEDDTYRCTYLSETKFVADTTTSSVFCTMTGILRQPGDFRILAKSFMVSWSTLGGHMSIFVTTTNTGTLSASASPRCSEGKSFHTNKQQKRFRRSPTVIPMAIKRLLDIIQLNYEVLRVLISWVG